MQGVIQDLLCEMATMEEMAAIFKRFGDEQSTLLDQYERLSFEVQLNKAMLGRSLSEPAVARSQPPPKPVAKAGRRVAGFRKAMKKLFSPILGKKTDRGGGGGGGASDAKNPQMFLKTCTRSLRV